MYSLGSSPVVFLPTPLMHHSVQFKLQSSLGVLLVRLSHWKYSPSVVVPILRSWGDGLWGNIMNPDRRTGLFQIPFTPVYINSKNSKETFSF